jgi:ribonuclease G
VENRGEVLTEPQEPQEIQPESNVAASAQEPPGAPLSERAEDDQSAEFMVLPGESLAKYRRPEVAGDTADESRESYAARPWDSAAARDSQEGAGDGQAASQRPSRGFGTRIKTMFGWEAGSSSRGDETPAPSAAERAETDTGRWGSQLASEESVDSQRFDEAAREPLTAVDATTDEAADFADEQRDATESLAGSVSQDEDTVEAVSAAIAESDHPAPGLPRTDLSEILVSSVDEGAEDSEDDDQTSQESSGERGENRPPEEARMRDRSRSSRYLNRRGRRGRRRGRGQNGEPVAAKPTNGAASEAPSAVPSAPAPGGQLSIADLLSKGREILVQIAKEPLGRKGARITSYIALPGRYLVYMPTVDHVGVSRKIASDGERGRLRSIVQTHRTGMPGGFIVRTAGSGASEEEVRSDMMFLHNLWLDIREKAEQRKSPGLIHQDLDIVERILRDQLGEEFKNIWVDGEEEYERILRFVERFQPELLPRVKLYTRSKPIFDEFNITVEIEKALRPKVWLKSGGYIVINQTEALVAIDVNTGKYVGKSDRLEDTIVNTNLEAVKEVVRQMRLRDLGGIIVVDFIDMDDRKNRHRVMAALEQELRNDSAPSKALQFNDFGLVAITRKRVKQSLERALCSPCPYCEGAGSVKSIQTITHLILEEARKVAPTLEDRQKDVTLRVNPEVAKFLKSRSNTYLQEIEEHLRSHVLVRGDLSLHREHFDIN